jgi:hypothetical protein
MLVAAVVDVRFLELRAESETYVMSHFPSISVMLGLALVYMGYASFHRHAPAGKSEWGTWADMQAIFQLVLALIVIAILASAVFSGLYTPKGRRSPSRLVAQLGLWALMGLGIFVAAKWTVLRDALGSLKMYMIGAFCVLVAWVSLAAVFARRAKLRPNYDYVLLPLCVMSVTTAVAAWWPEYIATSAFKWASSCTPSGTHSSSSASGSPSSGSAV